MTYNDSDLPWNNKLKTSWLLSKTRKKKNVKYWGKNLEKIASQKDRDTEHTSLSVFMNSKIKPLLIYLILSTKNNQKTNEFQQQKRALLKEWNCASSS